MFGPTIFSTSSLIKQFLVFRVKHFQILHLKFLFAAITFTIPTSNQVAMARAGDVAVQDVGICPANLDHHRQFVTPGSGDTPTHTGHRVQHSINVTGPHSPAPFLLHWTENVPTLLHQPPIEC